jgi:putative methyltransferase (TIGR04325 family)
MATLMLRPAAPLRLPGTLRRLAFAMAGKSRRVPVLGERLEAAYGWYFNRVGGQVRMFRGIFPDFGTAKRAIPDARHVGYDNEASADRVADDRFRIIASDYPVLFWLQRLLPQCRLLFDWGGNIGISYYAYRRHLRYPGELTWLISDVPAVVRYGEKLARQESAPHLRFTVGTGAIAAADVLLAAGSLQFIEDHWAPLRKAGSLPQHVVLNKIPAFNRRAAVTLQNMGTALCPYHLFNRDALVRGFEDLGYRLVDEWAMPDCACRIPFYPEQSIAAYSGFYFAHSLAHVPALPMGQP